MFKSSRRVAMLALVATVCAGFLLGKIPVELFMTIVTTVIAFFFGQRSAQQSEQANKDSNVIAN
jgi:uncharacterized membrane protein